MNRKLSALSHRYAAALKKHLKEGPQASLMAARGMGRQAVRLGLEMLDVARIHKGALATLQAGGSRNGIIERAEIFFTEVVTPIEITHLAALKTNIRLSQLNKTLDLRTVDLTAANRFLKQSIAQGKTTERALRKSGGHSKKLLEESRRLQKDLQHLTHQILSAQEDKRKKVSHELQDEIGQTLLGINVRLLTLKKDAAGNAKGFKKDIADTQKLVKESIQSITRFAGELHLHQRTSGDRSVTTALRRDATDLSASACVANRNMKTKSRSVRRLKMPAHAGRETTPVAPASRSLPVVAMAASAGGLKALSVILGGLPADFPAAIVIVMHLSPVHKSLPAEILNCRTHLKVKQVHSGDKLCHSGVFVAPPNHRLFVQKGGRIRLSSSTSKKVRHARLSAEPLFASVADIYKKKAIGVVLTGGDGNGSLGVQIIKENGGKVIAQDRPTSQDFSMPETSIKTGDVDFVLPLNEIAPKLMELVGAGTG